MHPGPEPGLGLRLVFLYSYWQEPFLVHVVSLQGPQPVACLWKSLTAVSVAHLIRAYHILFSYTMNTISTFVKHSSQVHVLTTSNTNCLPQSNQIQLQDLHFTLKIAKMQISNDTNWPYNSFDSPSFYQTFFDDILSADNSSTCVLNMDHMCTANAYEYQYIS